MESKKGSLTTLCYLEQDGKWLMMHRIKKEHDVNRDKWIGVGGHAEAYESPEDCLLREVEEETGLRLTSYRFRGLVTFVLLGEETQYMCLYTADRWEGKMAETCWEGVLEWVEKERVPSLNLWVGDLVFFRLLQLDYAVFSLKLTYDKDELAECVLDGRPLDVGRFLKGEESF